MKKVTIKDRDNSRIPVEFKNRGTRIGYGMTEISISFKENQITISHHGNMGASLKDIEDNVNHMLGAGAWTKLGDAATSSFYEGSPDYSYTRKLNF